MGCNCKNGSNINELMGDGKTSSMTQTVIKYSLKIMGFLLLLLALPLINIYIVWLMFDMLVLNNNVDIKPLLLALGKKFEVKEEEDDEELTEEEFMELTEDDVVLLDSNEIIEKA